MPPFVTGATAVPPDVRAWLASNGSVFREFPDQDSHCVSVGLDLAESRWFIKWSDHPRGVESLRRAMALHARVRHPALIPLAWSIAAGERVVLAYPFVAGAPARRPSGGEDPFRRLPLADRGRVVDGVLDLHLEIADRGFVAVDLYDGCIMARASDRSAAVFDLDEYRPGPFALEADRLPGSTRFMAPEEFERGARIDQVTNVFTLARLALVLLGDHEGSLSAWPGGRRALEVLRRATTVERASRHPSVGAFVQEYREAMGGAVP